MARISTYVNDTNVSGQDKLLGSDSTEATRNFPISSLAGYLDNSGSITVSDQINLRFVTLQDDISNATFFKDGFGGDGSPIGSLTTVLISKKDVSGSSLAEYTQKILNSRINIVEVGSKNNFAVYVVSSITTDLIYTNFFRVTLLYKSGNGTLSKDKYYSISAVAVGDLSYTHTQLDPEAVWTVSHNLGKKPSVTVVDSADTAVIGEIDYIDENNVTLTFIAAFSGKAYFN